MLMTSSLFRNLLLISFLFLSASVVKAATFTAAGSGPWTTAGTWTLVTGTDADGIPDGDDTVTIPNTRVVTVTGAQTVQNITVNGGGTLTINAASTLSLSGSPSSSYSNSGTTDGTGSVIFQGTSSFTINGTFTASLVIASGTTTASGSTIGGSVTVSNGATLNSTNQTITINGNLTVAVGGLMTKTSGSINANGSSTVNHGTITGGVLNFGLGSHDYSGSGVMTASFVVLNGSTVTLASGVTLGNGATATSLTVNGGGVLSTGGNTLTLNQVTLNSSSGSLNGGGVVRMQGTSSMAVGANFTAPLEINAGTTNALSSTVGGSLTIANGATLDINNQTININGNFTNNAGGLLTNGAATSGTVNAVGPNVVNNGTIDIGSFQFSGSGIQNFSGSGSVIDSVTVFGGSVTTLVSDVTIGDGVAATTLAVNTGGTLAMGNFVLTANKVSVSGNGTYTSTGGGKLRTQGNSAIGASASFTSALEINSGTTTASSSTFGGSLTVLSGATLDLINQTINVVGTLTVNAGGTISRTSGIVNASGNTVNNGTITGGSFVFTGSGTQTYSGTGVLTGSVSVLNGSVTTLTSDATFGNGIAVSALTLNGGGTIDVGSFTLTLNGVSLTGGGASTSTGPGKIRMQNTCTLAVGAIFTASLEINSGTTTASSSTIGGPLTILGGATMNITNQTINPIGDLAINIGGILTSSSGNGIININSSVVTNNGSITDSSVRFSGTSQTLSGTGIIDSPTTILNGSITTLGSDHRFSTLVVNAGGTFATATFTAFLSGAGTALSGGGTIANVNVTYNGTAAQTVQTSNVSYNRLGIDNPAGVTLSAAETVASRLTLTNGLFNNGGNLTLSNGATIARANGSLQASPTFSGVINIEYFGSNAIASALEIPPSNTIINLTDNNTNTVTLSNSLAVNGNATLAAGSTLTGAGGTTLTFNGASFSNSGTESVPTTTFNGTTQAVSGSGAWTGATFQLTGGSNTSLANNVTFSNGSFTVGSTAAIGTGANTLIFNGTSFTNAGFVTGAVRTTGANVGLTTGASGFNASLTVNGGTTTTSAPGVINGPVTVDATAVGLVVNSPLTVIGNLLANSSLSGGSTLRVNGSSITNNAVVSVSIFSFGGAAQALGGTGSFTGNASILSGSNTTLAVDKQMGSVTVNSGGTFNITNRSLFLSSAGNALSNSGTLTTTGSTVEYNGVGAQSMSGTMAFNNLSLNNAAGVTGPTTLSVGNLVRVKAGTFTSGSTYKDVQIDSGATLAGTSATTINVSGNWLNNGTFTANNNTVNFNGPLSQSVSGSSATSFNNLTAASAGIGLVLAQDATVTGVLTLTGDLITNSFLLTMPSSGTSAGTADVIGNVRRTGFTGGGAALSFGNPFNSIAFTAAGTVPTGITVNLTKTIPALFPNAIQRTYTITPTGGSGFSATVRLHYLDAELNGNAEAGLKLFRFNTLWTQIGASAASTTNNWAEQSGVTAFSPWTLSVEPPPIISGKVSYKNTLVANYPVPNVALAASGSPSSNGQSDVNGDYALTGFGAGTYTVTPSKAPMSSMASNGIFSNDAALISQHVVGLITLNANQQEAAKVGGQPTLTAADAGLIAQWIVGIGSPLNQTGTWLFTPGSMMYSNITANVTGQNYAATLKGDVDGNWLTGPAARPLLSEHPTADAVLASLPDMKAAAGEIVKIPFGIENLQGKAVTSFQFDVEYDPEVLEPIANSAEVAGTLSENLAVASNSPSKGLLKVVVYGAAPVQGDGIYLNLRFKSVGADGSTSKVIINEFSFNDMIDEVTTRSGVVTINESDNGAAIKGHLATTTGKPVANAVVFLTSTTGARRMAMSDSKGAFEFDGLELGDTYSVTAHSERHNFSAITVSVIERVNTLNMIADR